MKASRRWIVIIALFLAGTAVLSLKNYHEAVVYMPGGAALTMPTSALIILAFTAGMGLFAVLGWLGEMLAPLVGRRRRAPRSARQAKKDLERGEDAYFEGDLTRAESLVTRAAQRDPDNVRALIRLADIALAQRNTIEAVSWLNKATQRASDDVKILFRLAEVQEEAGEFGSAIDVLRRIIDSNESNRRARAKLLDLFVRLGRWDEARLTQEDLAKELPRKSPERAVAQARLRGIRYEYARSLMDYARRAGVDGAGVDIQTGGDTDPGLPAVHEVKRPLAKARKILEDILKEDVEFVPAAVALGDLHTRAGDAKHARNVWERTLLKRPQLILLSRLEEHYLKQGTPGDALDLYRRVSAAQPDDIVVQLFLTRFYLRLEMVDEAKEVLQRASARGEGLEAQHLLAAEAEYRHGDADAAVKEFKKALGYDRRIPFPHVCTQCGAEYDEWRGFCLGCQSWNTVVTESRARHVPMKELSAPPPGSTP